jgi:glutathione peroxidase
MLYDRYRERGFAVLGFPSNDFAQEPGSEKEIQRFCRLTYSG